MPRYIPDVVADQFNKDPVLGVAVTDTIRRVVEEYSHEFIWHLSGLDHPRDNAIDDLVMGGYRNDPPGVQAEYLARYDLLTLRHWQTQVAANPAAVRLMSVDSAIHRIQAWQPRGWYTAEYESYVLPIIATYAPLA